MDARQAQALLNSVRAQRDLWADKAAQLDAENQMLRAEDAAKAKRIVELTPEPEVQPPWSEEDLQAMCLERCGPVVFFGDPEPANA